MVDVAVLTTGSLSLKELQIAQTPLYQRKKELPTPELALVRSVVFEKTEMKYDSTGMFHWVPAQTIEDCTMVRSLNWTNTSLYWHSGQNQINECPDWPRGGLPLCRP